MSVLRISIVFFMMSHCLWGHLKILCPAVSLPCLSSPPVDWCWRRRARGQQLLIHNFLIVNPLLTLTNRHKSPTTTIESRSRDVMVWSMMVIIVTIRDPSKLWHRIELLRPFQNKPVINQFPSMVRHKIKILIEVLSVLRMLSLCLRFLSFLPLNNTRTASSIVTASSRPHLKWAVFISRGIIANVLWTYYYVKHPWLQPLPLSTILSGLRMDWIRLWH